MSFWIREFFGWILILLGLFVFYLCLAVLLTPAPQIIQSGPIALIGIIIFRGGIHLLKVSVAARVAMQAQRLAEQAEKTRPVYSQGIMSR